MFCLELCKNHLMYTYIQGDTRHSKTLRYTLGPVNSIRRNMEQRLITKACADGRQAPGQWRWSHSCRRRACGPQQQLQRSWTPRWRGSRPAAMSHPSPISRRGRPPSSRRCLWVRLDPYPDDESNQGSHDLSRQLSSRGTNEQQKMMQCSRHDEQ